MMMWHSLDFLRQRFDGSFFGTLNYEENSNVLPIVASVDHIWRAGSFFDWGWLARLVGTTTVLRITRYLLHIYSRNSWRSAVPLVTQETWLKPHVPENGSNYQVFRFRACVVSPRIYAEKKLWPHVLFCVGNILRVVSHVNGASKRGGLALYVAKKSRRLRFRQICSCSNFSPTERRYSLCQWLLR